MDLLLRTAQSIALRIHRGETVDQLDRGILDDAFGKYGPEGVYMDGELFCQEQY